jgi:uncharacterized membrane protein YeaQ/YmgE (transglycosylase-associated protein family)
MIAIALDTLIAHLLSRKKLGTFLYLIYGLIGAIFVSAITPAISSSSIDETPGVYLIEVISGTLLNSIAICLLFYFFKRRQKIKKAAEHAHAEDQYWEQNEHELILKTLEKYKDRDFKFQSGNTELELNLSQMSTEEILKRLETNNFSDESIPSALKVLSSRL